MPRHLLLLAALPIMLTSASAAAETPRLPTLDSDDEAELAEGETIVRTSREEQHNRGDVVGLVCAPIDELWAIVRDFNNMHEWFPDMIASEIINNSNGTYTGAGSTDMPWPVSNRTWQLTTVPTDGTVDGQDAYTAEYSYVPGSGNMDDLHGYWLLTSHSSGCTLVRYVVNADLGVWLPDAIINWATRSMLPGIIEGLRERHGLVY